MKSIQISLSRIYAVRFLVAILFCAILVFSNAIPVLADSHVNPNAQSTGILSKAKEELKSPPTSLEEVEGKADGGLNEVQGTMDKDKMFRSDSSGPAVVEQIENALDKAMKKTK
ncbi:hypothetical protein V2H45_14915 [Tumidithrix elongata RA019]|uniref:Low temperature-induced protein n=1 Tax=Tumidithrix elongata BACA0141 TaxID=2716417 RepID=A0AAW9Q3P7_9CYAN|nr:hypothetical protein [Tumidithrix elongata RA019]